MQNIAAADTFATAIAAAVTEAEAIAKEADVDVRSVWKRLSGEQVRGRAGVRIEAAIARRRALAANT